MKQYSRVLTIAGSDSGGGAGIQADIKAISATGSYAASAITAVTVQNTLGVEAVHPVPPEIIAAQIRCVLSDIGANAIKIGMLHSAEVVLAVRDALLSAAPRNIVLDPVMVATSGHRLIEESAIKVLVAELMPLARVITPNIPEAEIFIGRKINSQEELPAVARELSEKMSGRSTAAGPSGETAAAGSASETAAAGSAGETAAAGFAGQTATAHSDSRTYEAAPCEGKVSVLMKAGHLSDERLVDVFYNAEEDRIVELPSARVNTPNTHGTGCTLSSAFASYLAQGFSLDDAARAATEYIHQAIVSGADYEIGCGHGPVNHFWKLD